MSCKKTLAGVLALMFSDDEDADSNTRLINGGIDTLVSECETARAAIGAAIGIAMGCAILGDEVEQFANLAKQIADDREVFEDMKASFFKAMALDDLVPEMDELKKSNSVH